MTKAQHTPGPWEIGLDDEPMDGVKGIEINGDDGKITIAYVMAQEITHYTPIDRANARFIVTACNSHYELLEELERAAQLMENYARQFESDRLANQQMLEHAQHFRAAIQKARGQ